MLMLRKLGLYTLAVGFAVVSATAVAQVPGQGEDAGKTVVYRDTWGVPHIYAPTAVAGMYAMGYAQAEDRPHQLLKNFLTALGESARFQGEDSARDDLVVKMFDHYGAEKKALEDVPENVRAQMDAFAQGVNDWYAEHPEDLPEWWPGYTVDAAMCGAFSRLFLFAWSIDQGFSDLRRAGIEPGVTKARRASNQFAISPERSAEGAPILYIDPHLSWFGVSRFWEFRVHAGDLVGSGFTLAGSPFLGLGHNENLAWAMTTGGPDTADVFEVTLHATDPMKYLYDGEWREFTTKEVTLHIKDVGEKKETVKYTHHGPVVATEGDKAYALKTAYHDAPSTAMAWYHFNHAEDYKGAVKGMETLAVFPQNVMVADTSGNIYYQRTGRVPMRPAGFNYDFPVNGSTPASEWTGLHPASDLVQVLNPPHGYMQNTNIPPDVMMYESVFKLEDYPAYIWSDRSYGPMRSGWTNQRGARAIQLLHNDESVTIEEALAYANNVHPYGVERWLAALKTAHERFGDRYSDNESYQAGIKDIFAWDKRTARDSTGALKYAYWRMAVREDFGDEHDDLRERVDHYMAALGEDERPVMVSERELARMLDAFNNALGAIVDHWGSLDATYGDRYRVGRDDQSWPVGGGGDPRLGLRTLRSVGFSDPREDNTQWGRSGQTSTEIVVLSKPIKSWTYVPIGQSDRPDSPHYADQAEKLFSPRQLKETWWLPEDLAKNIESRAVLEKAPAPEPKPAKDEPKPEGDTAAIQAIVDNWMEGLKTGDAEMIVANHAEDYADAQSTGKEGAFEWISGVIAQGFLDNVEVATDDASIEINGNEAIAGPYDLSSAAGAFTIDLYLENREGTWLIVSMDAY